MKSIRVNFYYFALLGLALLLQGCLGTSKATRFYALDNGDTSTTSETDSIMSVAIFELPEYLNRPEIVIRTSPADIKILKFDHWAEPLDLSVSRRLVSQLDGNLPSIYVYSVPGVMGIDPDYQLLGTITKFEANSDGTVKLNASWAVTDRNRKPIGTPTISVHREAGVNVSDVSAVVSAMGRLLDQLALEMAAKITSEGIGQKTSP